ARWSVGRRLQAVYRQRGVRDRLTVRRQRREPAVTLCVVNGGEIGSRRRIRGIYGNDSVSARAELADEQLLTVSLNSLEWRDVAAVVPVIEGEPASGCRSKDGSADDCGFCKRGECADDDHRTFSLLPWRLSGHARAMSAYIRS